MLPSVASKPVFVSDSPCACGVIALCLRTAYGQKGLEVTGEWRTLYHEELESCSCLWVITQRVVFISYRPSWPQSIGPIGCPDTLLRNYHCSLLTLEMGPIGCPETSVRNYHYSPRCVVTQKSTVLICFVAEAWNAAQWGAALFVLLSECQEVGWGVTQGAARAIRNGYCILARKREGGKWHCCCIVCGLCDPEDLA